MIAYTSKYNDEKNMLKKEICPAHLNMYINTVQNLNNIG